MFSQVSKTSDILEDPFHLKLSLDGVIGFLEVDPPLFIFLELDFFSFGVSQLNHYKCDHRLPQAYPRPG